MILVSFGYNKKHNFKTSGKYKIKVLVATKQFLRHNVFPL